MNRSCAVDAGVSGGVILVVSALAAGWYGTERAVPTPATPVENQSYRLGQPVGDGVEFRAPSGWSRVPTGRADVMRFVHPRGGSLTVWLTTGMTDYDTAAPRRLRELGESGVSAHFTNAIRGIQFTGRRCDASTAESSGECAVVSRTSLLVTVLTLHRPGGPLADVTALVNSMREARE